MRRKNEWRLVDTGIAEPAYTAAVDEALLRTVSLGKSPPTLHFYMRMPPAVTIGRFLNVYENVNVENCRRDGVKIIRRMSGGGPVYTSKGQLIYGFSSRNVMSENVESSLGIICRIIENALRKMGIPAEFSGKNDILLNGKKISGSAQFRLRKYDAILQHGTVIIDEDLDRIFYYIRVPEEKLKKHRIERPEERVTSIRKEFGEIKSEDLKKSIVRAFSEYFNADFYYDTLTSEEREIVVSLVKEKYGNDRWNMRGRRA